MGFSYMDAERYLKRINYVGTPEPSLAVLKKLQRNHLFNVPFENLDIHLRVEIELDIEKVYDKVVDRKRGGFCYELNGLFYELLCSVDFDAKMISARVYDKDNGYGQEFDHMAIIVRIDDVEYLCDVGFGDFAVEPLRLDLNKTQRDQSGDYLIDKYQSYFRVSKFENEIPVPQYIFSTDQRRLEDYNTMCIYHQTNPQSHFTRKKLVSRPIENGRITISGNRLKRTESNKTTEIELGSEAEFRNALKEFFELEI